MSDPERLLTASDNEIERLLLRSGRAQAPQDSRHRALVAATAALGASGLVASTATAGGAAVKTGSVLSLKWLTFFGVTGLGAMTAAVAVSEHGLSSQHSHRLEDLTSTVATAAKPAYIPHAPPTATAQPPAPPDDTAAAASAPPAVQAMAGPSPSTARTSIPTTPAASGESSVHAELGTLEQARRALAAGEPARALSLLDAYSASYPRGSMGPEATVLRVEALVRAGDPSAAARLGNAFLASNPQSPYAGRVRALLGASNP